MSNDVWRWADPDGQQRRVRLDELRAALAGGHIAPNTPVWRPGWPGWQSAHEVPELTSASMGSANGVVLNIPPPPLALLAAQQDYEKKSESLAPAPPSIPPTGPEPEPPPPPRYVPVASRMPSAPSSSSVNTVVGLPSSANMPFFTPGPPSADPGNMRSFAPFASAAPAAAPPMPPPSRPTPPPMVNISTTIGMPSAPVRAAAPGAAPTAVATAAPTDGIELLDSASLVDSGSSPDLFPQPQFQPPSSPHPFGAPPPSTPDVNAPLFLHDPPPRPPGPFELLVSDLKNLKEGRPLEHKPLVIGAAIFAAIVVLGLFGTLIGLVSGGGSGSAKTSASASASASGAPPSTVVTAPVMTSAPTGTPSILPPPPVQAAGILGDCSVSGDSRSISPHALGAAAIEGQALNGNLALGFAASSRDGIATMLDPTSFGPLTTAHAKPAGGDIRRVLPVLNGGKLAALPDVDRRGDPLSPRRSVATSPLLDVGATDDALVWAPHGKDTFANLFALEGDAPVEALRATPLRDRAGIGVTFRRDNAIRIGLASGAGSLAADGALAKIDGLGQGAGTLGSPSIASTGDRIVVAWADRASTSDDWEVRWTTVAPHGVAHEATPFALPEGGLGGNAMSPALASLGGGRFLLAWTEGPVSGHHVRAITFAADGSTSGAPITISAAGENAGQPAIALNDDGNGVVAYLSAKGKGLEVHVTPITCPRQP